MLTAVFVLVLAFCACNIVTEWLNRRTLSWKDRPISDYLADVPWAWVQDAGFAALAVALVLLSIAMPHPWVKTWLLLAVVGIFLVVGTAYAMLDKSGKTLADIKLAHKFGAALAFGGTTVALLMHSWHTGGLVFGAALAAPASVTAFFLLAREQTALAEKAYTACLMVSLGALAAPPIIERMVAAALP